MTDDLPEFPAGSVNRGKNRSARPRARWLVGGGIAIVATVAAVIVAVHRTAPAPAVAGAPVACHGAASPMNCVAGNGELAHVVGVLRGRHFTCGESASGGPGMGTVMCRSTQPTGDHVNFDFRTPNFGAPNVGAPNFGAPDNAQVSGFTLTTTSAASDGFTRACGWMWMAYTDMNEALFANYDRVRADLTDRLDQLSRDCTTHSNGRSIPEGVVDGYALTLRPSTGPGTYVVVVTLDATA